MITSEALFALSRMAPNGGHDMASVLIVLARAQAALEEADEKDRRLRHAEQQRADAERRRTSDVQKAEVAREDARLALGDGWHPLKSGGAVLLEKGEPVRLRDGGDHSDARREAVWEDVIAIGWKNLVVSSDPDWSDDGEALVRRDEIPF